MSDTRDKILKLVKQLYPSGRAFYMPFGGASEKTHRALAESQATAYEDCLSILNDILPDNDYFSADDATAWERRLGIISSPGVSLEDRKKAIALKLNYPVTEAPRQHYKYIEKQLQAAGFNVWVHENNFSGSTTTPEDWLSPEEATLHADDILHAADTYHRSLSFIGSYHADDIYHADDLLHGVKFDNIVANHIDRTIDSEFVVGSNYRFTFYIAGETMPDFAIVNPQRENELRQLILQLKPAHTVALLFINFQ